ncbi:FUSC family protein [Haloechinothrix sp. LS1_15]|uniref:FUSC family protein n=1 Tax=Haloechinothrix sp. LS1_15 TaxID=2652248 RepID=UPI0029477614|nr:FUSC family protein [Haloechinothrix sp. LS1_15]MDV6011252.1 FUSC family protein [Haloechinothrix sp. LS1_15]
MPATPPAQTSRRRGPPLWLVQLLRRSPVPVPWARAARAALALALPLAVGFTADRPEYGVLVSIGALPVVLAEHGGPYRQRALRMAAATAAATAGYGVGLLTMGMPVLAAAVIVLLAVLSVHISAAGEDASIAGMLMLVFGVLGAGQYLEGVSGAALFLLFVLGSAWGLAVTLAGWVVRGTDPERAAVAQVFVELAVLLSVTDERTARAARHQLTVAMNTAYDQLLHARAWVPARDATHRRLLTLLTQATPVVEAAVAMVARGRRAPRPVVDHLMDVATAVLGDAELPRFTQQTEGPSASPAMSALYSGLARLGDPGEQPRPRPLSPWRWLWRWLRSSERPGGGLGTIGDRATWRASARLALCMAIAEALSLLMPLGHAHWIPLTVALVLKPELGSVFGRAVLRAIGTVAGVGLAAPLLLAYPHGLILAALAAIFAGGVAIGKALNYGILSACMTPLIIIQLDVQNLGEPVLLAERLTHTLLGCAVVLVFGYWLWPGSLRPGAGTTVAASVEAVRDYIDVGLRNARPDADRVARRRARRQAYRALADLRAALGQVLVEPSAAGRQALLLWSVAVGLERVADAVTEVCVHAEQGSTVGAAATPPEAVASRESGEEAGEAGETPQANVPPPEIDIARLTWAMDELAAAARRGTRPERVPLPENPALAGVSERVESVFEALRGADYRDGQ